MNTRDGATYEIPELPTLEPGFTLLEADDHARTALQTLAVDQVLLAGGTAIWAGTGRHCVTGSLAELAPSRRILDRIKVARGFTPYQHTALLRRLSAEVTTDTSVVVIPELDHYYRGDDVQGADGRDMLVRALATIAAVAREHDVPILCTRRRADEFTAPVEAAAAYTLRFRETPMGPRFVGEEFETQAYPLGDGWVQTTLAFWRDILEARQPLHAHAGVTQEVSIGGAH